MEFEINGLSFFLRVCGSDKGELPSVEIVDEDFSTSSLKRPFGTIEDVVRAISEYTTVPIELICKAEVSSLLFRMGVRSLRAETIEKGSYISRGDSSFVEPVTAIR